MCQNMVGQKGYGNASEFSNLKRGFTNLINEFTNLDIVFKGPIFFFF